MRRYHSVGRVTTTVADHVTRDVTSGLWGAVKYSTFSAVGADERRHVAVASRGGAGGFDTSAICRRWRQFLLAVTAVLAGATRARKLAAQRRLL